MIPKEVFHYTKTSTALEKILFKKQLKIGQLKYTNDPKETKEYAFDSFQDAPSDMSVLSSWIIRLCQTATPLKLNEWKVLCFSINHDDLESGKTQIYENPLLWGGFRPRMWAHYAENHKGMCIKFNGEKLDEEIKKAFVDKKYEIFSGIVEYKDEFILGGENIFIPFDETSKLDDIKLKDWLRQYFIKDYKKIFLRKSRDWESEYEFRWLLHSKNDSPEYISINGIAEEVIVSCDFEEAYYPSLFRLCDELKIPAYRVFWDNGKPGRKSIFQP